MKMKSKRGSQPFFHEWKHEFRRLHEECLKK